MGAALVPLRLSTAQESRQGIERGELCGQLKLRQARRSAVRVTRGRHRGKKEREPFPG